MMITVVTARGVRDLGGIRGPGFTPIPSPSILYLLSYQHPSNTTINHHLHQQPKNHTPSAKIIATTRHHVGLQAFSAIASPDTTDSASTSSQKGTISLPHNDANTHGLDLHKLASLGWVSAGFDDTNALIGSEFYENLEDAHVGTASFVLQHERIHHYFFATEMGYFFADPLYEYICLISRDAETAMQKCAEILQPARLEVLGEWVTIDGAGGYWGSSGRRRRGARSR